MKVKDLIEMLEDCDENAEVRLAFQPEHPFEYNAGEIHEHEEKGKKIVYISERGQIGYLSAKAAVAVGWADADDYDEADEEDELDVSEMELATAAAEVAAGYPRKIETLEEVKSLINEFKEELGAEFDTDRDFEGYCPHNSSRPRFTKEEATEKNRLLEAAREVCEREGVDIAVIDIL
jgi:hypothetical protein